MRYPTACNICSYMYSDATVETHTRLDAGGATAYSFPSAFRSLTSERADQPIISCEGGCVAFAVCIYFRHSRSVSRVQWHNASQQCERRLAIASESIVAQPSTGLDVHGSSRSPLSYQPQCQLRVLIKVTVRFYGSRNVLSSK